MIKRALIIGGAGFIGSHLTRYLRQLATVQRIVVLDNFSVGWKHYVPSNDKVTLLEADAASMHHTRDVIKREEIDTVFHLAANADIAAAVADPTIDFNGGTVLLHATLEAMRPTACRRLFYMSGSGVYGEYKGVPFKETDEFAPISPYGANKAACEMLTRSYCFMHGYTARVFRFANVVGARQTHGVGFDFLRQLKEHPDRIIMRGDGEQSKSYVHISDVLAAIFSVAHDTQRASFEAFNVANDDAMTVREIAELVVTVAELPTRVDIEASGGTRGWAGDVPVVRLDCSKIRGHCGWYARNNSATAMLWALRDIKKKYE